MQLVEMMDFQVGILPKDITGAAQVGDYICMKYYSHLTILILQGAWAAGTPAVTLVQAQDVAGTGAKALAFTKQWSKTGITGGAFAQAAVVSNTFNLPATANSITALEVDAEDLDVNNGFDCLSLEVASPGANADLLAAVYLLSGARYAQALLPDSKLD